jgi:hypothetical protein
MRANEGARRFAPFRFQQDGQRLWCVSPLGDRAFRAERPARR